MTLRNPSRTALRLITFTGSGICTHRLYGKTIKITFNEKLNCNNRHTVTLVYAFTYGCAMAQAVSRRLLTAAARVRAQVRSGHVGFVKDKVALRQVFSEYFGFLCHLSWRQVLHTDYLSSGDGAIRQLVSDVPNGLSRTAPQQT
jgi:hypothetical protein